MKTLKRYLLIPVRALVIVVLDPILLVARISNPSIDLRWENFWQ